MLRKLRVVPDTSAIPSEEKRRISIVEHH